MRYIFTLFSSLFIFSTLASQSQPIREKLSFQVNAEAHGEDHFYSINAPLAMPGYIKKLRQLLTPLPITFDTITDNPFQHGAMYAAVKTRTRFAGKVELKADLYGEYRGFSYGSFNKENTIVYPVISVSFKDSFRVGNGHLKIRGETGQYLNEKVDEGLMIYNVDLQGTKLETRYKNSELALAIYGDLSNAIGLGIDDLYTLSYTHHLKNDSAAIGASFSRAAPPGAPFKYHSYYGLFGHLKIGDFKLYGQLGGLVQSFSDFDFLKGFWRKFAGLLGVEHDKQWKKVSIKNRLELRYYGIAYNIFHQEHNLRYRDSAHDYFEMYNNTRGNFLYPLRKFNTPFSQWAVFTEYLSYNVFGASLTGNAEYRISRRLSCYTDYDINGIYASLDKVFSNPEDPVSAFIYPFYKVGIRYFPVENIYAGIFIGNKTMNLDLGYPTQYLLKRPYIGIEFHLNK